VKKGKWLGLTNCQVQSTVEGFQRTVNTSEERRSDMIAAQDALYAQENHDSEF
jgi:hypothetical protein